MTAKRPRSAPTPNRKAQLRGVPQPKRGTYSVKPARTFPPKATPIPTTLGGAVSRFGAATRPKLTNPTASGQPEDQLRGPLEHLLSDLAVLCGTRGQVVAVGESAVAAIKTRPDYAVTVANVLVGFVEVKAPGKGADPRKFKDRHDREQWDRLQALPNLVYTDGNAFSLWRNGELVGDIVELIGDVITSGADLDAPPTLLGLIQNFLEWKPIAPRDAKQLAETSARLCRLLRDEVTEQLALKNKTLTALATDWRKLLFPDASDAQFADGYAQAVTFGLLMARARNIELSSGLDAVARKLGQTLIGTALRVLTEYADKAKLTTSLDTMVRVLDAVDWGRISTNATDAWLYFYEDFLAVYDNRLRKLTGSYYTPARVVKELVRLVDEVLRTRFALSDGLAAEPVTLIDPAVGTGTFLLGVLRHIAASVEADQGPGAVPAAIEAAMKRLMAFEVQLGPFAVAQLRLLAELKDLMGATPVLPPRMYVTDTLANPYLEQEYLPLTLEPIAESRRQANEIKKHERIMVVLGNPPYKEKAKGRGAWIETGDASEPAPLEAWMPPASWGVGAHAKHLRNLYVYFWRWATWKVFDHDPNANHGIVCFITVAGFLTGPGFEKMRDYLRRATDEIWVIDCSPEGHQPDVSTRIFEGVQQPICIVLASRSPRTDKSKPAKVRYQALPKGHRSAKFDALGAVTLDRSGEWVECSPEWRAPFRPSESGAWSTYPALDELFVYDGSGVMPGRTWVIAPDADSLRRRWQKLQTTSDAVERERLFHPHLRGGKPGDKHSRRAFEKGLPGHEARLQSVADDRRPCIEPVRYAFRSFDRQWIIPDNRVINQPNPELWTAHSNRQVYLTALVRHSPTNGPALTFAGLIPDHDHYKGSFAGRVLPLWLDHEGTVSNVRPALLKALASIYRWTPIAEDVMAYIAGIAAHPAYTKRFQGDLATPGLRIPITADADLFREVANVGRTVIWLHCFGERFADTAAGRPHQPPRLPRENAPQITSAGAIGREPGDMPDEISYDAAVRRLHLGAGFIDGVPQSVWEYEVSGKQVLRQWFSYRKANRERPLIGDRRPPSPLGDLQPDRWLAEYTTELMHLLNVLGRLVELEAPQAALLERVCAGRTIMLEELRTAGAFEIGDSPLKPTALDRPLKGHPAQTTLPIEGATKRYVIPRPEFLKVAERVDGTAPRPRRKRTR